MGTLEAQHSRVEDCDTDAKDWSAGEPHEYPSQTDRVEVVRQKDRVTYQHNVFQIDLTQVKQPEVSSYSLAPTDPFPLLGWTSRPND